MSGHGAAVASGVPPKTNRGKNSVVKRTGAIAARQADDEGKRKVVRQGFEKKAGLDQHIAELLEVGIHRVACPNGELLVEGSDCYKEYKTQYKRLSTHLRQNASLAKRLKGGDLVAEQLASMGDQDLMADTQKNEISQFQQEGLKEALGISMEDTAHWTPSSFYSCPISECGSSDCLYIQTFKGGHGYDDNNIEPAITVRCRACKHLWKEDEVDGGRLAAGSDDSKVAGELLATSAEQPELWTQSGPRKAETKDRMWWELKI